nr:murein transglycosylase [Desulfobacula sp.]
MNKRVLTYQKLVCALIFICMVCGCRPAIKEEKEAGPLKKLKPGEYPLFMDHMDYQGLLESMDNSLIYFRKVPVERQFTYEKEIYTAGHMIRSLETLKAFLGTHPSTEEMNGFIKDRFLVYEAIGNENGQVLFTGYFEPTYEGRLQRSDEFPHPLFSKPDDLLEIDLPLFSDQYKGHKRLAARVNEVAKKVVPYYTRKEITASK